MTNTIETAEVRHRSKRRSKLAKLSLACGILALILAIAAVGLIGLLRHNINGQIHHISGAFPTTSGRPLRTSGSAQNWLLLGSDRRSDKPTTGSGSNSSPWRPGEQRTDTIMLLHISGARDRVSLISFPRDSWVEIPGAGKAKINAAFSYGGPPLLIRTVEHLTGVRIDHFGVLDFIGFMKMTEALGGVDVKIAQKTHDPTYGRTLPAGTVHLDGTQALNFVRQRHGLPGGDFDRIKRQQAFLEALGSKAMSAGTLLNPLKLNSLLKALTSSVTFDDTVTADTLRFLVPSLAQSSLTEYFTAPVASLGIAQGQDVVHLDKTKTRALFDAVRRDQVGSYVADGGVTNAVGAVR